MAFKKIKILKMTFKITKKELEHLVELARIEIKSSEEEKLAEDLGKIIGYFEELKGLNTKNVLPMSGGTFLENIFQEKDFSQKRLSGEKSAEAFPERQDNFLKIPPVFE